MPAYWRPGVGQVHGAQNLKASVREACQVWRARNPRKCKFFPRRESADFGSNSGVSL